MWTVRVVLPASINDDQTHEENGRVMFNVYVTEILIYVKKVNAFS